MTLSCIAKREIIQAERWGLSAVIHSAIDGASKLGGCILEASNGTQVKVPWSRIYDSLAFKFVDLELRPRMGAMFYHGSNVYSSQLGLYRGRHDSSEYQSI